MTNFFMNRFTQEDLLQFLYNEASAEKSAQIKAALAADWNLREEFELLAASKNMLGAVKMQSPRTETIDAILRYAEKSEEVLSSHA